MELSIIVPVYNVEKYLEKCINSLVNQTLAQSEYEIIIVNDGSPDNSQSIIERFAKQYTNIVPFIKENGGLSDARNYGIDKAKGDYIAFVDSDDYVDSRMYEVMLKKAREQDFDMVVCDFKEIYDNYEMQGSSRVKQDLLTRDEVRHAMLDFYPSAWNKIYKKELFENIRFKKGVWFEDVECLYRMFPKIKSVGVVKETFCFYMQRTGSISRSADLRIFHYVDNWNGVVEYYKSNGYMEEYRKELEFCYVRYLYATFIKACLKCDRKTYKCAMDIAIKEVKRHFRYYRSNSYFYSSMKGIYCVLFNKLLGEILYIIKSR